MRYISAISGILALVLFAQIASATTYYYWGTNHSLYDANTVVGWKTSGIWTTDGVNPSSSYPDVGDTAVFYSGTLTENGSKEVAEIIMETTADSVTAPTLDNEGSLTVDDEFDTITDDSSYVPGTFEQGLTYTTASCTINEFTGAPDLASNVQVAIYGGTVRTGLDSVNQVSTLYIDTTAGQDAYWNIRQGAIYVSTLTSYSTVNSYVTGGYIYSNSGYTVADYDDSGEYTLVYIVE